MIIKICVVRVEVIFHGVVKGVELKGSVVNAKQECRGSVAEV